MSSGKVVLGLLAGIAAGVLAGILFAPAKGSDTRKKITKKGKDYEKKFTRNIDLANKKFDKLKSEVSDFIEKKMPKAEAQK